MRGPERETDKLKPRVATAAMNLWKCDLLKQWKIQINSTPKSEISHKIKNASEKNIL